MVEVGNVYDSLRLFGGSVQNDPWNSVVLASESYSRNRKSVALVA